MWCRSNFGRLCVRCVPIMLSVYRVFVKCGSSVSSVLRVCQVRVECVECVSSLCQVCRVC